MGTRLSPLDSAFLAVESPTAHMHVGWVAIFEPPDDGPAPTFEDLRDHIADRLPRAPRYRQMLCPVPFELNSPEWMDDLDFDVSRHLLRAESESLGEVVAECMSEPLPRDRPLWQICVVPRLEDGRIALVGKTHHCMVDGIAAVELASLLVDPEPDPPDPEPDDWKPKRPPGTGELIAGAIADFVRTELDLAVLPARVARSPERAFRFFERAQRAARALADAARPAEPAPAFNEPISPLRHLGLLGRPMKELGRIKDGFGVKLNDVVLAVSAGGVRRFLQDRGQDPIRLKAMVPVSVREPDESGELGNRISYIFVDLPCDEPDPIRRLRDVYAATSERKEIGEPEGADTVMRSISFTPAPVQRLVSHLVASPRTFNLVVSNIPGPSEPLYMRGCLLAEAYPVVPIADRHSLSIGFTTVRDECFFGLYADQETLPDVDELAADIDASIDELLELSEDGGRRAETVAATPPG